MNGHESMFSIFVILIGIIMCSVMPNNNTNEPKKPEPAIKKKKKKKKKVKLAVNLEDNLEEKIKIEEKKLYEDWTIEDAIKDLKRKGEIAREIVPTFPQFPDLTDYKVPKKGENRKSIGETCCGLFLKLVFPNHKFIKVRPDWLKNPATGKNLELDLFCEELMIAVEYNGEQHYVFPHYYNKTEEEFLKSQTRDKLKEEICTKRNICLIRVPYTVPPERIPIAIYSSLLEGIPEFDNYFKR